jgi:endonuclease/exonuclease/phosphatase family metal-dependent hydrolase
MHTHRILLLNLGYETGLDGSLKGYLTQSWRYLHTPEHVLMSIREGFQTLIAKVQPDICCVLEMHHDPSLLKTFAAYQCRHIDPKYGNGSMLRRLPFFRDNCNGIFAMARLPCRARQFKHGTKKLLYDVQVGNDFSLLVSHYSLHASVRQQQFHEIAELVQHRKHTVVCGDFNDFGGRKELGSLLKETNLRIIRPAQNGTFPAYHPRKPLDLFLCSKDIKNVHAEVLKNVHLSDHLPVLLTVTM